MYLKKKKKGGQVDLRLDIFFRVQCMILSSLFHFLLSFRSFRGTSSTINSVRNLPPSQKLRGDPGTSSSSLTQLLVVFVPGTGMVCRHPRYEPRGLRCAPCGPSQDTTHECEHRRMSRRNRPKCSLNPRQWYESLKPDRCKPLTDGEVEGPTYSLTQV